MFRTSILGTVMLAAILNGDYENYKLIADAIRELALILLALFFPPPRTNGLRNLVNRRQTEDTNN